MNPLVLPPLTKHVTDYAAILSPEQVESLSRLFATHEYNTTEQVLTVLIPHREWNELLDIGLKLFNENKIGQKDLNNWLLLIVSTEEKKLRIITGKGMEIKYSEMVCREIVEKYLRPLLNEGKYEEMVKKWGEIIQEWKFIRSQWGINIPEIITETQSIYNNENDPMKSKWSKKSIFIFCMTIFMTTNIGWVLIWSIWIIFFWMGVSSSICAWYLLKSKEEMLRLIALLCIILAVPTNYIWIKSIFCMLNTSQECIQWSNEYQWIPLFSNAPHTSSFDSSSDYDSSYDSSSSSSYDGGGGSSNGGGYGD